MSLGGLTIAVPRGALLRDTLDLLDRLGADTSEGRIVMSPASSNSSLRSLARTSAVSTPSRSSRSSVSRMSAPRGTAIRRSSMLKTRHPGPERAVES